MGIISAEHLVKAWEAGTALPHAARAIELLAAVEPDTPRSVVAALPLGERDRRLLCLRRSLLGPLLDATVQCPHCSERVEFEVDVDSLLVRQLDMPPPAAVDVDGVRIEFRLPTSTDLLELARSASGLTELTLMTRCVTRVVSEAGEQDASLVARSAIVCDAVASRMADLDPQADIQLSMSCPACDYRWSSEFDVVSYFWVELTSLVRHLLVDVHRLALAYGWAEVDILAMSGPRRSLYLEMIGT